MEERNDHLLINYLDRILEEKEMRDMEALINSDKNTRTQFQLLKLAIDAVEYSAIYDQVASVKENFREIQPVEVLQASYRKPARVFRLGKAVRIAAAVLILVIGIGSYKFFSVNATHVYSQTFIAYTLPTTRGEATTTDIEQAYRQQNWAGVIATVNRLSLHDNKALFLSGMAHLQLKNYAAAGRLFKNVLANNTQTNDDLFRDEALFYLALSELGTEPGEAIKLFHQIQADKSHKYHAQANKISSVDLQILQIKVNR